MRADHSESPSNVPIIDISDWLSTSLEHEIFEVAFLDIPSGFNEGGHQIEAIEEGTAGPDVAIANPAFLHPVDLWRSLLHLVQQEAWAGGSLAVENASLCGDLRTSANGDEGAAGFSALLDEFDLDVAGNVANVAGGDDENVQMGTGFEGVLPRSVWCKGLQVKNGHTVGTMLRPLVMRAVSPVSLTQWKTNSRAWAFMAAGMKSSGKSLRVARSKPARRSMGALSRISEMLDFVSRE